MVARAPRITQLCVFDQESAWCEASLRTPCAEALKDEGISFRLPNGCCGFMALALARLLLRHSDMTEVDAVVAACCDPALLLPELIAVARHVAVTRPPASACSPSNFMSALELSEYVRREGAGMLFLRNVQVGGAWWQWSTDEAGFPPEERAFVSEEAEFRDLGPEAAFVEVGQCGPVGASPILLPASTLRLPLGAPVVVDLIGHFVVCVGVRGPALLILDTVQEACVHRPHFAAMLAALPSPASSSPPPPFSPLCCLDCGVQVEGEAGQAVTRCVACCAK